MISMWSVFVSVFFQYVYFSHPVSGSRGQVQWRHCCRQQELNFPMHNKDSWHPRRDSNPRYRRERDTRVCN